MSSEAKDPVDSTPSESSDSDSEVGKAEENLEHLKIQEGLAKVEPKDDADKTKPLKVPKKDDVASNYGHLNEPIAGPSGLQPHILSSDDNCNPDNENIDLFDSPKDEADKEGDKNTGTELVEGDSDTTESTPPCIQSDTSGDARPPSIPSRKGFDLRRKMFQRLLDEPSSSSFSGSFASDSANTLSDVPEICSEVASYSGEGSEYREEYENFQRDQSADLAMVRQCSETSDSNISEIPDDYCPPLTSPKCLSAMTPSEDYDDRSVAELPWRTIEKDEDNSSLGIASPEISGLGNMQLYGLVGATGFYRRNPEDMADSLYRGMSRDDMQDEEPRALSEPLEVQATLQRQRIRNDDMSLQCDLRGEENREEHHIPEDVNLERARTGAQKVKEKFQTSDEGAGSPSKQRKLSTCRPESGNIKEKATGRQKPTIRPDSEKRSKMVPKKQRTILRGNSESPEPKSTSSDEFLRKESPEIRSSSDSSKGETDRKLWQKSGGLRRMQHSTMTSEDMVIAEETDRHSFSKDQGPEFEYKNKSPEYGTVEKSTDVVAMDVSSDHKLVQESTNIASGSDVKEQGSSFKVPEVEQKAVKSPRLVVKLGSSPRSSKIQGVSKEKVPGPKEKAKAQKPHLKSRKTRHDHNDPLPEKNSDSSTSDESCNDSPDEEETEL